MRNFNNLFFTITLTFFINGVFAQNLGINATGATPDPSALLDINALPTNDKGLLIPRVPLLATNNPLPITSPALSLLVYNTSTAGVYPNNVLPGYYYWNGAIWIAFETKQSSFNSVDSGSTITSSSSTDALITGMTLSPAAGTYVVNFNSQCLIPNAESTSGINTTDLCADLSLIYTDITSISVTNTTHALTFGSGDTLDPGVYSLSGAVSVSGSLTLDGGGNPNSLFIIRSTAAFNTVAGSVVTLINGASPENIYWVAQDAVGIGANTTIQGNIFSNSAAIAVGSSCTITGRLLTKAGAISFGPGTLSLPVNPSTHVDLLGVDLGEKGKPITSYASRLFEKEGFHDSLTFAEKDFNQ